MFGFGQREAPRYEWMTHNGCHEVTSVEFCDWMEVNVEVKKERRDAVFLHYGLKQGAFVLSTPSGWRRIGIHGVDPWGNVSLGCIVSHIRSHLEDRLPTSLCSASLSPPLALPVHSSTNTHTHTHTTLIHRLHSSQRQNNCTHTHTHTHTLALLLQHTQLTDLVFYQFVKTIFVIRTLLNCPFVHFHTTSSTTTAWPKLHWNT